MDDIVDRRLAELAEAVTRQPGPPSFTGDHSADLDLAMAYLGDVDAVLLVPEPELLLGLAARLAMVSAAIPSSQAEGAEVGWRDDPQVYGAIGRAMRESLERRFTRHAEDDLDLDGLRMLETDLRRVTADGGEHVADAMRWAFAEYAAVVLIDISAAQGSLEAFMAAQALVEDIWTQLEEKPLDHYPPGIQTALDPGEATFHLFATLVEGQPDSPLRPATLTPSEWRWTRVALCAGALATMPLRGASDRDEDEFWARVKMAAAGRISLSMATGEALLDEASATELAQRSTLEAVTRWLGQALRAENDEGPEEAHEPIRDEDDYSALRDVAAIAVTILVELSP